MIKYNGLLIPQTLLRTKYTYDMQVVFDWVKDNYETYDELRKGKQKL